MGVVSVCLNCCCPKVLRYLFTFQSKTWIKSYIINLITINYIFIIYFKILLIIVHESFEELTQGTLYYSWLFMTH